MGPLTLKHLLTKLRISEEFDVSEIESLRERMESLAHFNYAALEYQRYQASNTLKKKNDFESAKNWKSANLQIINWLQSCEKLTVDKIFEINRLIHPSGGGSLRNHKIYAAMGEFLDPTELPYFEPLIKEKVLEYPTHPLLQAAQVYQWISSFHPFSDGNGRTARLATDYILMSTGYVPICFHNPFDAMVGIHSASSDMDGNYGVIKLLKGLQYSYHLLMLPQR
jgi:hypothetical protein